MEWEIDGSKVIFGALRRPLNHKDTKTLRNTKKYLGKTFIETTKTPRL